MTKTEAAEILARSANRAGIDGPRGPYSAADLVKAHLADLRRRPVHGLQVALALTAHPAVSSIVRQL